MPAASGWTLVGGATSGTLLSAAFPRRAASVSNLTGGLLSPGAGTLCTRAPAGIVKLVPGSST